MQGFDKHELSIDDLAGAQEDNLSGQVDTIIFRNHDNGYSVLGIEGDFQFIAVGTMPELEEGDHVKLYGTWTKHHEYGRQYRVSQYEPILPHTEAGIIAYLSSSMIKGLGPKRAARLVREFGLDTLEILAKDPYAAASVKGISTALADSISEQLREKRQYQELVILLAPIGTGPGRIMRIFKKWGSSAVERIRHNPYCLAEEIEGTGFLTADKLARELGIDPLDDKRLESALLYWLSRNLSSGHTWSQTGEAIIGASNLISENNHELISAAIKRLTAANRLICCDESGFPADQDDPEARLILPQIYKSERSVFERLLLLAGSRPQRYPDWQDIREVAGLIRGKGYLDADAMPALSQEQTEHLASIISSQISVLTGGPGTGKTTMIKTLCQFVKSEGGRIILAAPTGRAARRLSETTGEDASTLHRLLALPVNGQQRSAAAAVPVSLQADFVVVDEASMLDIFVFDSLLQAILPGTRLVLTGDADQLPSIGPGQILRDIIQSNKIPVMRLTQIYRQAERSLIVSNAHRIREGKGIEIDQSLSSSFIWIHRDNTAQMAQAAENLCSRVLSREYKIDPIRDAQVLTPVRKGECGTYELNRRLQAVLNQSADSTQSSENSFQVLNRQFSIGDKVIQLRNQYELEWVSVTDGERGQGIMNGETGIITAIDRVNRCIRVLFDDERQVIYTEDTIDDLDLAYAVTVHKSQGSEYPAVVLVLPPTAPSLLNRQLLYTAATRARQHLFIISNRFVLDRAIANNSSADRRTMLGSWLSRSQ
ncbi:MAG: ATP-dependent RecD-like DNA helicase [Clostridiaceae bacterium]|nr:ATP-dependent RecD-like DNA helicase [Clostridiaceae bacterium]